MFTDLFRLVSVHELAILPEVAAVFRALATLEGTLGLLAPRFNIVEEARTVARDAVGTQLGSRPVSQLLADELYATSRCSAACPDESTASGPPWSRTASASTPPVCRRARSPVRHRSAQPGAAHLPGCRLRGHRHPAAGHDRRTGGDSPCEPLPGVRLQPAPDRLRPGPTSAVHHLPAKRTPVPVLALLDRVWQLAMQCP